jgi:hypothetical protein
MQYSALNLCNSVHKLQNSAVKYGHQTCKVHFDKYLMQDKRIKRIKRLGKNFTNTLLITVCGLCEQPPPWSGHSWYANSQWSFTYSRNYQHFIEHNLLLLSQQEACILRKMTPVHPILSSYLCLGLLRGHLPSGFWQVVVKPSQSLLCVPHITHS